MDGHKRRPVNSARPCTCCKGTNDHTACLQLIWGQFATCRGIIFCYAEYAFPSVLGCANTPAPYDLTPLNSDHYAT